MVQEFKRVPWRKMQDVNGDFYELPTLMGDEEPRTWRDDHPVRSWWSNRNIRVKHIVFPLMILFFASMGIYGGRIKSEDLCCFGFVVDFFVLIAYGVAAFIEATN